MTKSYDADRLQPHETKRCSRRRVLQAGAVAGGLWAIRPARASRPNPPPRIAQVRLHPVTMARIYTTRVAPAGGHGEGKSGSRYLLLELTTEEGTSGWGELSDIEPDWNIPDISVLQRFLEIRLKGREVLQRQRMSAELADEIPADWHRELRRMFALTVDTALLDLAGRIHRVPAYELLGGLYRDRLPISWVAFIRDPARSGLKEPLLVRDALKQFGPPPSGSVWFMDHPNASVVRLADGHWHHLLIYRILDRGEHSGGVAGSSDRALCRGGHLARPANPGVELCVKNDECAEAV